MIETRAVRTEELDAMLEIMCAAFELTPGPARELFFRDPFFNVENKRVLVADGRVVSCLTVADAFVWIGPALVPVAGLAGVATHPDFRRRGFARRLLCDTVAHLRGRGTPLSALIPCSPSFYRRAGWERAAGHARTLIPYPRRADFAEVRQVRPAIDSDRNAIGRLYDRWARGRTGCCKRDERRWRALFDRVKGRALHCGDRVDGYVLYEFREDTEAHRVLRILELVAETDAALRGLAAFLSAQKDLVAVEHNGPPGDPAAAALACWLGGDESGCRPVTEWLHGAMFRVVGFEAALRCLAPCLQGLDGTVDLICRDSWTSPPVTEAVRISGGGGSATVEAAPARRGSMRIEGDSGAWAAVLAGCWSLEDAAALNRLHVLGGADWVASPHFPRRNPCLPLPDHF